MDDLTRIKGIGKATAAKLAATGVATFAAIAAVAEPVPDQLLDIGSAEQWAAWRAEAAELAPKADTTDAPRAGEEDGETAPATAPADGDTGGGGEAGADDDTVVASGSFERLVVSTAKRSIKSRRRAGLVFGPAETAVDPQALGEEALKALCADPALKVEILLTNGERFRLTRFPPDEADAAALLALAGQEAATGDEADPPA